MEDRSAILPFTNRRRRPRLGRGVATTRSLRALCLAATYPLILCVTAAAGQSLTSGKIADPAIPTATTTAVSIAPCTTPPKIDGDLDDPCWKTATHAVGFFRYLGTAPVDQQTEAWICADKHRLYVAFHCQDSQPNLILANETLRNGNINSDDYVGVTIDSQNTRHNSSSFQVSARGTQVEQLEGGTADNITWAGDWLAAVRRTNDGWNCEISIPFALMRYPRGAHAMGILLTRKLARETSQECWPYMSRDDQVHFVENLTQFTGIDPAYYQPRPIFLPYALATGGEGYTGRFGLDAKYPFSTTMTALGTINPDFQDVAQAVQNINFTYDNRSYPDSRPFFAEGSDFDPYQDVFYSRAIGDIDEGIKVEGKQDGMKLLALATASQEDGGRSDEVFSVYQDVGKLSDVHLAMAKDDEAGIPGSIAAKAEGNFIFPVGRTQYQIEGNHEPTWADGRAMDARDYTSIQDITPPGKPSFYVDRIDTGPAFTNNIGIVNEVDTKGYDWHVNQQNQFDTGQVWDYGVFLQGDSFEHHTGGFFHNSVNANTYIDWRNGVGIYVSVTARRHEDFRDHVNEGAYYWGERTLYSQGYVDYSSGTQADNHYSFLTVNQGYAISRMATIAFTLNRQRFGDTITTQTVTSGTYRLNSERSIGLRCVTLNSDTDFFLSFAQKARRGSDVYVLVGDPNSPRTRGLVTLKVITPF